MKEYLEKYYKLVKAWEETSKRDGCKIEYMHFQINGLDYMLSHHTVYDTYYLSNFYPENETMDIEYFKGKSKTQLKGALKRLALTKFKEA